MTLLGMEIVSWAERPGLAHRIYAVAVEAYADVPGGEDAVMEPFEDYNARIGLTVCRAIARPERPTDVAGQPR
jgi:hypothetical protein